MLAFLHKNCVYWGSIYVFDRLSGAGARPHVPSSWRPTGAGRQVFAFLGLTRFSNSHLPNRPVAVDSPARHPSLKFPVMFLVMLELLQMFLVMLFVLQLLVMFHVMLFALKLPVMFHACGRP